MLRLVLEFHGIVVGYERSSDNTLESSLEPFDSFRLVDAVRSSDS